jgi:hypothetical protein
MLSLNVVKYEVQMKALIVEKCDQIIIESTEDTLYNC